MIVTVTVNPADDVTYEVASMNPGDEHRVSRVRRRPGAKGVNVAAALAQLGEPVVATGLADEEFANHADKLGLQTAFVHGLPRVRRTVAVVEPGRRSGARSVESPTPCTSSSLRTHGAPRARARVSTTGRLKNPARSTCPGIDTSDQPLPDPRSRRYAGQRLGQKAVAPEPRQHAG